MRCDYCGDRFATSWGIVRQACLEGAPLHCGNCRRPLVVVILLARPEEVEAVLRYLGGPPSGSACAPSTVTSAAAPG